MAASPACFIYEPQPVDAHVGRADVADVHRELFRPRLDRFVAADDFERGCNGARDFDLPFAKTSSFCHCRHYQVFKSGLCESVQPLEATILFFFLPPRLKDSKQAAVKGARIRRPPGVLAAARARPLRGGH